MNNIDCCPHCGSKEGFYTKLNIKGKCQNRFNYDGSEHENGDMHDNLAYTESKYTYCLSCNKRLFKVSEMGR